MTACGLWLAPSRLIAIVVEPGGRARRTIRAALTDDARSALLEYLAGEGCELVALETLVRSDPVAHRAVRRGLSLWTAPDAVVHAIRRAAGVKDAARSAALLARLPSIALLRVHLRRVAAGAHPRQLPLL